MHHACASGSLEVLKWLIDNMKEVSTNMLKQKCEVSEQLHISKCCYNYVTISLQCNYTPLLMACEYKKEEIMEYLFSLPDFDVTTTTNSQLDTELTERGRTALHIAAAHNSLNIVKLLIQKRCPLTKQDEKV